MSKTYTASEFYKKVNDDLEFDYKDAAILICAILIACIGLNMNSIPTVIGAMLISPLMTPILAIGISGSVYSLPLFKKALKMLSMEIGVSLGISILYFWLSPISYASEQIIARTSPTVWDVLIALIGGLAGIIGAQKKDGGNIIPGVAIATALMPPLCTVGYAIAVGHMEYFLGSSYLFLINVVFIILSTILGFSWTGLSKRIRQERQVSKKYQIWASIALFIFMLPSLLSAGTMVRDSYQRLMLNQFLNEALTDVTVVSRQYDAATKTLNLVVYGDNPVESKALEADLQEYGLNDIQLNVQQLSNQDQLSTDELLAILEEKLANQTIEDQASEKDIKQKNKESSEKE